MSLRGTKLPIWNVRITLFQLDPSALAPCTDGLFSSGGITTIEDRMAKDWGNGLQAHLAANRSQFYRDLPEGPFYGYNQPGAKASEAVIANWWRQGMMGGAKAHYDGIVAFSRTDFTDDLKKIIVPVLVAALACKCCRQPAGEDDSDRAACKLSSHRRQPTVLAIRPAVFDRQVAAFGKGCFLQALAQACQLTVRGSERRAAEIPDHRHRRLLRPRHHGPRRRAPRAAMNPRRFNQIIAGLPSPSARMPECGSVPFPADARNACGVGQPACGN